MKENKLMKNRISTDWLIKKYAQFNEEYFNDELPGDILLELICNGITIGGTAFRQNPYRIRINFNFIYKENEEYEFENILIHEMIHIWQFINNYNDSHGKTFKIKMNEINSKGKHSISSKMKKNYKNITK